MAIVPVNSSIKMEDYWQFTTDSIEWLYVLHKLEQSVKAKQGEQHCLIGTGMDGSRTYLLSKKHYTTSTISNATGLSKDKLDEHVGLITLRSKPVDPPLPEATVTGWGEA